MIVRIKNITMPTTKTGLAQLPTADRAALEKYAGQPLTTGPQAKAYANHYILVHMNEASKGQTYSEVSGQYIQQCSDPKAAATQACQDLGGLRQTLFMGNTLRGLLLYGYAFATIGTIAGYAAIAAFAGAAILLVLVGLGFWHSRRASHPVAVESQPAGAHVCLRGPHHEGRCPGTGLLGASAMRREPDTGTKGIDRAAQGRCRHEISAPSVEDARSNSRGDDPCR